MRIIPVIDVLAGVVVRAVGGKRADYRPIQSKLTPSANPVSVAKALVAATGAEEVYVADLDAIMGQGGGTVAAEVADALPEVKVWIDQGVRASSSEAGRAEGAVGSGSPVIAGRRAVARFVR